MLANSAPEDRDALLAAYDQWEAAADRVAVSSHVTLNNAELLAMLARRERMYRRQLAVDHAIVARLLQEASPADLGGSSLRDVISRKLRISASEAARRIGEAEALGPRRSLTGEPLAPALPTIAAAVARGDIGPEHLRRINKFFAKLPSWVDPTTRAQAERDLSRHAATLQPEEFNKAADRLMLWLDQDGELPSEAEHARKRSFTMGKQGPDGMTPVHGLLDPEAAATLEAVLAKRAAPGMCHPDQPTPTVDGQPTDDQAQRDTRSVAQRNHDALKAMGRSILASGELGQHQGLPVTIVVTTTLTELESGAGLAATAGGTLVPMRDVIRLASHAYHYLVVYRDHTEIPLYLGRSRRTASPGQRIVLYARDGGCTRPGCTAPAYQCEAHHGKADWCDGGQTNIDELTLACPPDHRLLQDKGWQTRIRNDGRTEWIPPPHLDSGQARTNNYHRPQRYLAEPDDDEDPQ